MARVLPGITEPITDERGQLPMLWREYMEQLERDLADALERLNAAGL